MNWDLGFEDGGSMHSLALKSKSFHLPRSPYISVLAWAIETCSLGVSSD